MLSKHKIQKYMDVVYTTLLLVSMLGGPLIAGIGLAWVANGGLISP